MFTLTSLSLPLETERLVHHDDGPYKSGEWIYSPADLPSPKNEPPWPNIKALIVKSKDGEPVRLRSCKIGGGGELVKVHVGLGASHELRGPPFDIVSGRMYVFERFPFVGAPNQAIVVLAETDRIESVELVCERPPPLD